MNEEHEFETSIAEWAAAAVKRYTQNPEHHWIKVFREDVEEEDYRRMRMKLHSSLRTAAEGFWGIGQKELSNELNRLMNQLDAWRRS